MSTAFPTIPALPTAAVPAAYQTRPGTVTATQFLGQLDPDGTFLGHAARFDPHRGATAILVPSLSGGSPAFPGDWIVQDSKGGLTVVAAADFLTQYVSESGLAAEHQSVVTAHQQAVAALAAETTLANSLQAELAALQASVAASAQVAGQVVTGTTDAAAPATATAPVDAALPSTPAPTPGA